MSGESFLAWISKELVPTLPPGDVVTVDTLARRKIRSVRHALEPVGARGWSPPPYSPDFNPVEPMWSKIKQILRRHAPPIEDPTAPGGQDRLSVHFHWRLQGFLLWAPATLHNNHMEGL
jgi:transposase